MTHVRYPGMLEFVQEQKENGLNSKEIYDLVRKEFGYSSSYPTFRRYVVYVQQKKTDIDINIEPEDIDTLDKRYKKIRVSSRDDIKFLETISKHRVLKVDDLCNKLNCPPKIVYDFVDHYRSKGYEIVVDDDKVIFSEGVVSNGELRVHPLEEKEIIFGVAGDFHFGSKSVQITPLNEFCELARKKSVKHMFIPGDIVAGYNVYPGQVFDLYAISSEEQEKSVVTNLPYGFEWYALGGNHDYSFIRRGGGHNPLLTISSLREDFHYVGFDEADVPILPGVDLKMWHPSGGVPYSISYRLQKGVEQVAFDELTSIVRGVKSRPTIRFILSGHLHIQMQAMFGSIFGTQCGCFEGQTNYLKRKGLVPHVGGYIIEALIGKNGLLKNFEAKFYIFEEVKDDWKNYKHSISEPKITKPLFNGNNES